jgi:spore maturation protein CgeB
MEGYSFVVAGPQYPAGIQWPANVERIEHLPPPLHCDFYNSQRFTLNITRADMIAAGYSPSVRLFEAAACAVPIISDWWEGLDTLLEPDREILIAASGDDVISMLEEISPERARKMGAAASRRILAAHTAAHRAAELETHLLQLRPEPALKSIS